MFSIVSFSCSAPISVILGSLAICTALFAAEKPKCAPALPSIEANAATQGFFDEVQAACGIQVFAESLSPREREALHAFRDQQKLANGKIYGNSVREYRLRGKSRKDVEKDMALLGCGMKHEALREGGNGPIRKDARGVPIPLLIFLCPDGGVVRIKPAGDPGSRYRPQPHGSKALRFPADANYVTFDDEVLKVDETGNAVPKAPIGLAKLYSDEKSQAKLVNAWADDAHMDLKADE